MNERSRVSLGPDLVFAALVVTGLISAPSWLNDPGTLWHYRLGREINATGLVPRTDTLSFSHEGEPWVDQSWLFDSALARVVDLGGWPLAVVLGVVAVGWIYRSVAVWLESDGLAPMAALAASILAAGVGSIHFLVRPHLVTFALFAWTGHACRVHHLRGGRLLWTIPPLMIVWANCHGAFLAGPILVAVAAVGHAIDGPWSRARRARFGEFGLVLGLSVAATLVTPYGLDLYRHVHRLLVGSRVTDLINEYQPAPFGRPLARVLEWIVLVLVAVPSLTGRRIGRYDLTQTVAWLHLALGGLRHTPLFAFASAPAVGSLVQSTLNDAPGLAGPKRSRPVPALVASVGLTAAVLAGFIPIRHDPETWPIAGLGALDGLPTGSKLFHEQDWGGLIAGWPGPSRKTFIDDRFELLGRAGVLDYLAMLEGGPGWDDGLRRHDFDRVWVRPDRPLVRRLESDAGWRVVHRDAVSVLLERLR